MTAARERPPTPTQGADGRKSPVGGDGQPQSTAPLYQPMPDLDADEYAALKADIADRGVMVPVEYDEHGNVLDGHHRIRACHELGITDWPTVTRSGLDAAGKRRHARTLNLSRRHLSRADRRRVIADEITEDPDRSDRAIARLLGVDHKTVGSVRRELGGEVPQPEPESEAVSYEEARERTDEIRQGITALEASVYFAISNRVAPYEVAGWLQDGITAVEREVGIAEATEPIRRLVYWPLIAWVLSLTDDDIDGMAGPDVERKPLTSDEIDELRQAVTLGGAGV